MSHLLNISSVRIKPWKDHFYTLMLWRNPHLWVTRLSLCQLLQVNFSSSCFSNELRHLKIDYVGQMLIGSWFVELNCLVNRSSRCLGVEVSKLPCSHRDHNCLCSSGKCTCECWDVETTSAAGARPMHVCIHVNTFMKMWSSRPSQFQ